MRFKLLVARTGETNNTFRVSPKDVGKLLSNMTYEQLLECFNSYDLECNYKPTSTLKEHRMAFRVAHKKLKGRVQDAY